MSHACRMVISWYGGLYYESKKKKKKKDWGRKEKGELKEIYSFADFELHILIHSVLRMATFIPLKRMKSTRSN